MRVSQLIPLVSLAACSTIDTGEISYRRAERVSLATLNDRITNYADKTCVVHRRNEDEKRLGASALCVPLAPARLIRQNIGLGDPISKNDVYSIRLDHGLIAYLAEPPFAFRRLVAGKDARRKVGEVVVLANVFEFPETTAAGSDPSKTARFTDFGDLSRARVIYYSPDVEQGQNLNFSNIVLQEPVRYGGNPIGVQMFVLELDRVSPAVGALLKKLATLGQTAGVVPGGEVAKVLLDLGTSLLSQNHDDIIFEYRFVLDPSDGSVGTSSPPFEAGKYVLIREDERLHEINWRNVRLDYNTGSLFKYPDLDKEPEIRSKEQAVKAYEKNTYFTINIIKHPSGTNPSTYSFRSFEELGKIIEAEAASRDKAINEILPSIDKKIMEFRGRQWASDLVDAIKDLNVKKISYSSTVWPSLQGCIQSSELPAIRDTKQVELRTSAVKFVTLFEKAVSDNYKNAAGTEAPIFPPADQLQVLSAFVPFFAPFDATAPVTQSDLSDGGKFIATYGAGKAGLFADAVVNQGNRQGQNNTCDLMIARGSAQLQSGS